MENQKLCNVWSKRHLPEDLLPGILCRLPVKILLRFRSVSKSWLALIDDADFARLHLNNFRNNSDETHLLFVQNNQRGCMVLCSETFETDLGTIHTFGNGCSAGEKRYIGCCVDGLILLSPASESNRSSGLVWNPSIRKLRELPSLPKLDASPNTYLTCVSIGLGYDALAKDYKAVKLVFANDIIIQSETVHAVAIFSLGANSWKIIKYQGTGGIIRCAGLECTFQGLYFRGCLYFIASVTDLVSFELSSEAFSSVSLPKVCLCNPCCTCWCKCGKLALVDGGCTMAVFYPCREESSVWVLDTESMNWTRRYTFQSMFRRFLYIKKNGDILLKGNQIKKTEEDKIVWYDEVVSYSPETDEYKIVAVKRPPYRIISHVCGYVQSLILHK